MDILLYTVCWIQKLFLHYLLHHSSSILTIPIKIVFNFDILGIQPSVLTIDFHIGVIYVVYS